MPSLTWDSEGLGLAIAGRRKLRGLTAQEACGEVLKFFGVQMSETTLRRMEAGGAATVEHTMAVCQWIELPVDSFVRRGWVRVEESDGNI